MNKLAIPILLILFTLICTKIEAQQRTCGTDAYMSEMLQNSKYAKAHNERQLNFEALNTENPMRTAVCEDILVLPMAVHYQGISNPDVACLIALAETQVQILNDDYQGVNADITNWVDNAAASFPGIDNGEACIQFCLAIKGHPDGFGVQEGSPAVTINTTSELVVPAWTGYINIYVYDMAPGLLGRSPLGGSGLGDGVEIDFNSFSSGTGCGVISPSSPFNLGRTLTHELGHYLNLDHIWGYGCGIDDGVSDTPDSASEYYNCPNVGVSSCNSTDMHMNYMDYVNDACMYMFSAGQATRMENYANANLQHVLNNAAVVCARDSIDIGILSLISPVTSEDLEATEMVSMSVKNFGIDTITSFTVSFDFNGAFVEEVMVDSTLAADDIYVHTFATPVDMSAIGAYTFGLSTMVIGDEYLANNTLNRIVEKLARNDVAATDLIAPVSLCTDEATLDLVISNMGAEPLTSATLTYTLNGGAPVTINWTGNLVMGESESITVDATGMLSAANTIEITATDPNGEIDDVPENNTFTKDFGVNLNGEIILLTLLTDNYPEETSWDLKDENGNVLYAVGPYSEGAAQTTFYEEWCLSPLSCYEFSIYDAYGDGIQYQGVQGNYEVSRNGVVVASLQQADFGSVEVNNFCLSACNLSGDIQTTPDTSDVMGSITVILEGGNGELQYILDGGASQSSNIFEGLAAGEYEVSAIDSEGCLISFDAVIDSMSSNAKNLITASGVSIEPNPTNNIFTLEVEGLAAINELDITVFDATGKVVLETRATKSNSVFSKQISLGDFPEGLYFVHMSKDGFHQVHKVVKF